MDCLEGRSLLVGLHMLSAANLAHTAFMVARASEVR